MSLAAQQQAATNTPMRFRVSGYSQYDNFVQRPGVNPHIARAYRFLSERGRLDKVSVERLSGVDYMSLEALQQALMKHFFPYSALSLKKVESVINTDTPLNKYEARVLLSLFQRGVVYNMLFEQEQAYLSVGKNCVVLESKHKQPLKDKLTKILADENTMKLLAADQTLDNVLVNNKTAAQLLRDLDAVLGRGTEDDVVKELTGFTTGKRVDKVFNGVGNKPTISFGI